MIARPKPKAGDIVYVLGAAQGVVYRERPANDRLEAFCEAFKNPRRCQETNPSRARPERGFAWTGRKVRSQAEALTAKYQSLPSKMALAGGYLLTQSSREHLVKRTHKYAWLRGCCWKQVLLSDWAGYTPDEQEHQTSLPKQWGVYELTKWLKITSPLLFFLRACSWGSVLEDASLRCVAGEITPEQFESARASLAHDSTVPPTIEQVLNEAGAEGLAQARPPKRRRQAAQPATGTGPKRSPRGKASPARPGRRDRLLTGRGRGHLSGRAGQQGLPRTAKLRRARPSHADEPCTTLAHKSGATTLCNPMPDTRFASSHDGRTVLFISAAITNIIVDAIIQIHGIPTSYSDGALTAVTLTRLRPTPKICACGWKQA